MNVSINSINFEREMICKTCQKIPFAEEDIFGRLSRGTYCRIMHNKHQNSAYEKDLSIKLDINLVKYYPTWAFLLCSFFAEDRLNTDLYAMVTPSKIPHSSRSRDKRSNAKERKDENFKRTAQGDSESNRDCSLESF